MSILGNILWFVCGGLLSGLAWVLSGCLWCITIIGIPIGLQCFKFASLAFFPFGKEVVYGGGAVSLLANIVGNPDGSRQCRNRRCLLHYNHRNSIWQAVLQDCQAGAFAVRGNGEVDSDIGEADACESGMNEPGC